MPAALLGLPLLLLSFNPALAELGLDESGEGLWRTPPKDMMADDSGGGVVVASAPASKPRRELELLEQGVVAEQ